MKDNETMEYFEKKYDNKQEVTNVSEDQAEIAKINNEIAENANIEKSNGGISFGKKIAIGILASTMVIGGSIGAYFVGKKANTPVNPTLPVTNPTSSITEEPIITPTSPIQTEPIGEVTDEPTTEPSTTRPTEPTTDEPWGEVTEEPTTKAPVIERPTEPPTTEEPWDQVTEEPTTEEPTTKKPEPITERPTEKPTERPTNPPTTEEPKTEETTTEEYSEPWWEGPGDDPYVPPTHDYEPLF